MTMPEDALTPMPAPAAIIPREKINFTIQQQEPKPQVLDPRTGQPKRGRGRPPGSGNKIKRPDGGVNPPSRLVSPTQPSRETASSPIDQSGAKKEEKKARAEQYATYINQELNDKLFMFIIGATGMPAEALYKEGRIPPKAAGNPNLTELGNSIAIPADVADSWGKLLAELSYSDMGKSLTKASDKQGVGIVIAALSAAFSTFRYAQTLKPYIDMARKAQEAKANASSSSEGQEQ